MIFSNKKSDAHTHFSHESGAGFIHLILIIIIVVTVVGAGGFFLLARIPSPTVVEPNPDINPSPNPTPNPTPSPVACTQEAKLCPDGSYVSRTGPNCEFAECPFSNPAEKQITLQEGQRESSLLVEKIYPTYITGLNYMEYPIATNQGQPVTLYIGETAGNGCTVTLKLIKIEGKTATFIKKVDESRPCPICLAESTLIDTPSGQIAVQDLKEGMQVWTVDESGSRVTGVILETSKTSVPQTHQMVHVVLENGREVFASPGHPIGDGRIFNNLSASDILDGSKIVVAEKTAYDKGYTYDILPAGETGFYFANGILIGSTLKP